jgi:hypothetical protein
MPRLRALLFKFPYLLVAAAVVRLFLPASAHASEMQIDFSNVTFSGLNACGPSGTSACPNEVFNVSFVWNTTTTGIVGPIAESSTGLLGSFTLVETFIQLGDFGLTWQNSSGDQVLLFAVYGPFAPSNNNLDVPGSYSLSGGWADLSCSSSACNTDYGQGTLTNGTMTVTPTPEPSCVLLFASGLLGLGAFVRRLCFS